MDINNASLANAGSAEKHVCSTGERDTPTSPGDSGTMLVLNCNKWHVSFTASPLLIPTDEELAIEQAYHDALWQLIERDIRRLDAEIVTGKAST